eukprot:CAMPEP_0119500150 /NCGR_PEP_ID=MMETSP1344-20130328/22375_1 /TAXON_ID=236787 /ORGANISM="Florenciella parvula, Strain CCMP2471" /LENGTH=348 /DNA_ID=CAMNT_0007536205 /DNA_START=1 /DNA_END=1044 /DNA_ORIENTATION=+
MSPEASWATIAAYAADQLGEVAAGRGPKRHPNVEAAYSLYKGAIGAMGLNNHQYLVQYTQWTSAPDGRRAALEPNLVPYHLEAEISHWVLWHHPDDCHGKGGDVDDPSAEFLLVEEILRQEGCAPRADEAIIFQNHPSMRSVPTIAHSHVFFRPTNDERGRRLTTTLGTLREAWRARSPFDIPAGYERGEKLPPPAAAAGASANEHLLWSPGVLRSTVQTAAVIFFAWRQASRHPTTELYLRRLVEWWSSRLLSQAAAWQWWGALSLLSSSCCVIQLLLNSLSLGCAGFNTVLGPVRPAFLALTVIAQYHSVQVGLAARHLHVPMAVATAALSWSLTLAPELVYLYTM